MRSHHSNRLDAKGSLELHHSRVAASRVIEMHAGWFARNNVKAGTVIPELADARYCKRTESAAE